VSDPIGHGPCAYGLGGLRPPQILGDSDFLGREWKQIRILHAFFVENEPCAISDMSNPAPQKRKRAYRHRVTCSECKKDILFDCFVKMWPTCENCLSKWSAAPPGKNCPYAYATVHVLLANHILFMFQNE